MKASSTMIRLWVFSANKVEADTLLGKIDVPVDVEAAKGEYFGVALDWAAVEPVELSAQDRLNKVAKSNMRGASSSVGDRGRMADGTWYVFSSGDRHLFDVAEKREGGLGRVLFEIKPCKLDDGDLGGGGGFCGVLGGGCVACVGDEPAGPASYQETLASPTSTITV